MSEKQNPEVKDSTEFAYDVTRNGIKENKREFSREDWSPALRKSMNVLHDARMTEIRERGRIQKEVSNVKLRNAIVVSIVTALLVKAPDILKALWLWMGGDWR